MPRVPRKWTQEEDQILRQCVEAQERNLGQSLDWNVISQNLAGRNNKDCRKRWVKIDTRWNRGLWDAEEEELLQSAVQQYSTKWSLVSEAVGSRNPEQCARRWQDFLNPQIDHCKWSEAEDRRLSAAVSLHGRDWKYIATQYFPARSRTILCNRYTVIARRKKRLKGLNEGELPVPQHVESEIVETHQLSQTGQDLPPGFHERVDRKIGQSPEFFGWNDAQVLFHNGSCEFDGLPNLRSSSDVVLNQRIDSHHPDYYQLQSVLVDIETFPSELKEVSNQDVEAEHNSGAIMSSGQRSKLTTTTLTLENLDMETRTVILDILMKARIPTAIRID